MNFGLYNLSAGDLICITKVRYSNSSKDVLYNILILDDPKLEKNYNDSYWWSWGSWNNTTVYLLQWMYPYSTAIMAFTEDPVKNKNNSAWSFTIMHAEHHHLTSF